MEEVELRGALRSYDYKYQRPDPPLSLSFDRLSPHLFWPFSFSFVTQTYSKMLTAQILANEGGDNIECNQTCIKLNLLQAKKNDRRSIRTCLKKVHEFLRENDDPCQHTRLERLLKLSGVVFVSDTYKG